MGESNRDWWFLVVGFLYPIVTFGILLGCGGGMGPLAFHPLMIPLPALVLILTVIGLGLWGVRLRWWAAALFMLWLSVVVYAQFVVYAQAAAAV